MRKERRKRKYHVRGGMTKIWSENFCNSETITVQTGLPMEIIERRKCVGHVARMSKNLIAVAEVKMTLGTLRLRRLEFIITMANKFCSLTNKMHLLKYNKTYHKTYFILSTNSYIFRHQGAILRKFNNNKNRKSNTHFVCWSGRPHCSTLYQYR